MLVITRKDGEGIRIYTDQGKIDIHVRYYKQQTRLKLDLDKTIEVERIDEEGNRQRNTAQKAEDK